MLTQIFNYITLSEGKQLNLHKQILTRLKIFISSKVIPDQICLYEFMLVHQKETPLHLQWVVESKAAYLPEISPDY